MLKFRLKLLSFICGFISDWLAKQAVKFKDHAVISHMFGAITQDALDAISVVTNDFIDTLNELSNRFNDISNWLWDDWEIPDDFFINYRKRHEIEQNFRKARFAKPNWRLSRFYIPQPVNTPYDRTLYEVLILIRPKTWTWFGPINNTVR